MMLDCGFLAFDPARQSPTGRGTLDGVTFAVKDVIDVAGHVTGLGNPTWRRTHGPAKDHAAAVDMLLAAGASLVGKTHTDELAYSLAGQNAHYGTPPNPALPGSIPGGSSSGSASVVAAGLADVALGTDTGGSIRIPASYCGLFGMRPTHGAVDLTGVTRLASSFDTLGWFARSAQSLRAVGQVLLPEARTRTALTRIALLSEAQDLAAPELTVAIETFLQRIGLTAEPRVSLGDPTHFLDAFRTVQAYESWCYFGPWIEAHRPDFGPGVKERFALASSIGPAVAASARRASLILRRQVRDILGTHRVLCLATAAGAAPPVDASAEQVETVRNRTLRLTSIAGIAGCPQITLPLLRDRRGPVGLSLIGPAGSDRALLDLAVDMTTSSNTKITPLSELTRFPV